MHPFDSMTEEERNLARQRLYKGYSQEEKINMIFNSMKITYFFPDETGIESINNIRSTYVPKVDDVVDFRNIGRQNETDKDFTFRGRWQVSKVYTVVDMVAGTKKEMFLYDPIQRVEVILRVPDDIHENEKEYYYRKEEE